MDSNKPDVIKRSRKKSKKISKKNLIIIFTVIAVVCAAVSLIVHFATRVTNDSYENCAVGDVDGNGVINSNDALLVTNYTSNKAELFENQIKIADVNLDGTVDSTDALLIFRYSIGKINSLPYTESDGSAAQSGSLSAEISTDEVKISARIINIWKNDDGTYSYQLNIYQKNLTDEYLSGKKIRVNFSDNVNIGNSWDCRCDADGNTLSVSIGSVDEKSTVSCGVILTGSTDLVINNIEME
ncbi:MAG: dockerin type I repeat-containing protein [Clostridia bacterium]|nr:dockerin type I repeat-containing protein [Clostridia bacterium]